MPSSSGLTHCPALGTPYLYSDDSEKKVRRIIKTRCKKWTCPYCAEINAIGHYIRILNGINELQKRGFEVDFVTITSHEKIRKFEIGYRVWQSAWRKLQERARRYSKNHDTHLEFVYMFEDQKKGGLHVHGLFVGGMPTRWWKDNARQCGLGFECESKNVDNAGLATSYLVKYINKNIGLEISIPRFRRINYSRKFPPSKKFESTDTWHIIAKNTPINDVIESAWYVKHLDVELLGKLIVEI